MAKKLNPVEKAIKACGSQAELARRVTALGKKCSQQNVSWWLNESGGVVSPEFAPYVERAINGDVPCEELCPSVKWEFVRGGLREVVA